MLPRYIREMRRCNINASHEIFVAVLPFISLALRTLYRGRGRGYGGGWVGARRQLQQEASQRRVRQGPRGERGKRAEADRGEHRPPRPPLPPAPPTLSPRGSQSFANRPDRDQRISSTNRYTFYRRVSNVFRKSLIDGEKSALSETK